MWDMSKPKFYQIIDLTKEVIRRVFADKPQIPNLKIGNKPDVMPSL